MKKTFLLIIFITILGFSATLAQTLTVDAYGVSPRDVERDTIAQYFDRAYNGLLNVGTETKMFLKGHFEDSTLAIPTWTLFEKPAGSTADFGTTLDIDASTQLISLIPDVVGTYKVEFADGIFADTLIINAAKYFGVEGGTVSCVTCHNNAQWDFKYDKWLGTGHSDMLVRGLEGTLGSYYGEGCISCHTTGFDPNAVNDGFDDFPFVFPDTLMPGMYDSLLTVYPDAMARANIQCESCHGPGSEHLGNKLNISKTISTDNCASCHDSGTRHFFPEQWDYSGHASGNRLYDATYAGGSCSSCHNGQGFIDFVNGDPQSVQEKFTITCASCHAPHDATNLHQLRKIDATLNNGQEVVNAGVGALCSNCHKSRRDGVEYVTDYLNKLSPYFGPHYGPQTDMLMATNTYTWDETLPSSPHLVATENACVDCHMANAQPDADGIARSGGHTFSMVSPDGIDNVESCESCHGNIGAEFSDKKFFVNGNADLDGNGIAEGLQIEIQGLLDQLAMLLPPVGSTGIDVIDSSWTLDQAAGFYNHKFVADDRSGGIHNPQFAYNLLVLSITKNGGVVSVSDDGANLPTEYSLAQNYPNPFNPSTTIEYSLPEQSTVTITIYDAIGNELEVLFSGSKSPGTHRLNWNASNYASGIYFYKMSSNNFSQVKKMLLLK